MHNHFQISPECSIGFKSGLWLGDSRTITAWFGSHSFEKLNSLYLCGTLSSPEDPTVSHSPIYAHIHYHTDVRNIQCSYSFHGTLWQKRVPYTTISRQGRGVMSLCPMTQLLRQMKWRLKLATQRLQKELLPLSQLFLHQQWFPPEGFCLNNLFQAKSATNYICNRGFQHSDLHLSPQNQRETFWNVSCRSIKAPPAFPWSHSPFIAPYQIFPSPEPGYLKLCPSSVSKKMQTRHSPTSDSTEYPFSKVILLFILPIILSWDVGHISDFYYFLSKIYCWLNSKKFLWMSVRL